MTSLKVEVRRVDGSLQEFPGDSDLLYRLNMLLEQGLEGKRLADELFTDDWGPPPILLTISGIDSKGSPVHFSISYN
jgi:hypothetical protein